MAFDPKEHWEKVYQAKKPTEVSWYQDNPELSLKLICETGINAEAKIIDVGGGASTLAGKLLTEGFKNLTVLDISSQALSYAKERFGKRSGEINWIEADITRFEPPGLFDLWHDRAVFHFLTSPDDRKKYVEILNKTLKPGGHLIISAFGLEGPLKCSGLTVERYSPEKLQETLGSSFFLSKTVHENHITPAKMGQKFLYCCFRKKDV